LGGKRSGKIDVSGNSGFTGADQQHAQPGTFHVPGATSNEDYQTGMGIRFASQAQKVIAVAGYDHKPLPTDVRENFFIRGCDRHHFPQNRNFVTPMP
jgi:hypothetical protein